MGIATYIEQVAGFDGILSVQCSDDIKFTGKVLMCENPYTGDIGEYFTFFLVLHHHSLLKEVQGSTLRDFS